MELIDSILKVCVHFFGLGLFYVKNMMKLHKGKITLQSSIGVGTMFTLWFHNKK